jgi:putative oxidoreductase
MNTKIKKYFTLALRVLIAIIYVQTLYYKFTAHPESVYIFSKLGLEPFGRIGLGITELITALLIVLPATMIYGSVLSVGIISGAVFAHLFILGIEVEGDGGKLFYLALTVLIASILLLFLNKTLLIEKLNAIKNKYLTKY